MTGSPQEAAKADKRQKKQARALKIVSAIKSVMFVAEAASGYFAHSASMMADAFDMLQDALGAGVSSAVSHHPPRRHALVALAKAGFMAIGGLGVIAGATLIFFNPIGLPAMGIMGIVGGVALLANVTCAALLYRHRKDNINMKSSWKGIRNDAASNAGVLLAAGLGHLFVSPIPDLVVGVVVSGLCIYSAAEIALEARRILRRPENAKKKKPRKQAPPKRPQPKIVLGFKKLLRSVFNRKAAKAGAKQQTPVAAAPQATPAPEPVVNKPAIKPVQPETALPAPA